MRPLLLALTALLLIAPAAVAGTTSETAVARQVVAETVRLDRELKAAADEGERRADQRRRAGQECLETWRSAPREQQAAAYLAYFTDISATYWIVERPIYTDYYKRLAAIKGISDVPLLRRLRLTIRRELRYANKLNGGASDACATARAWAAGDWSNTLRPTVLLIFLGEAPRFVRPDPAALSLLRRRGGRKSDVDTAVARLRAGIRIPDARIEEPGDPVAAALGQS